MATWIRRHGFFDKLFNDLDEEIREMEEDMAMIFEDAKKISLKTPDEDGPYFYGFSMHISSDGKPHIKEFGNVSPIKSKISESAHYEEPFSEIIESEKEISIILELPGVEKNDIKLNASENELEIDVSTRDKSHHKVLDLPCRVRPETTKATYKNGILEVKITRAEKKGKGICVKVE